MRFLAPLALIAVIVAGFLVVRAADRQTDDKGTATTVTTTRKHRSTRRKSKARFYVVKAGDNLTLIAERTSVPLETLQQLNPDLDASTLSVGQKLRLTR